MFKKIFIKVRAAFLKVIGKIIPAPPIYYVGGSETLPPPLTKEEEQKALDARMIASQYSYRDWETWLPEGFERAEYRYLYGDMY